MKTSHLIPALLTALLLTGCTSAPDTADTQAPTDTSAPVTQTEETEPAQVTISPEAPDPIPNIPEDNHMQLIPDITFANGISIISQKDHDNGDAISTLGTRNLYNGAEAENPSWLLVQWDSGPCLYENMIPSASNVITDGMGRTFAYDPESATMTFELDTSLYYQGKPAVTGDWWPHLLIEQSDFGYANLSEEEQAYYRCDADSMVVSFDIRLTDYSITENPDDWVEAAQFLLYFYVKGVETNDFCWFGLRLFDNRWERSDNYVGYDGGKADASGAMIYSIGSKNFFKKKGSTLWNNGAPDPDGDFIHVEIDIKPYLEEMLALGLADGYFKTDTLSGLCINGMNMGWETIGTFDHTMEVRNLQLVSYRAENS